MAQNIVIAVALCLVVIAGVLSPCHSLCYSGFECLPKIDCLNRHTATNSLDGFVLFRCSRVEGNVCCPPVEEVRDPELNARLLPSDDCGQIGVPRIIGGEKAGPGQFPWMALLAYKSIEVPGETEFWCGGTLINNRYILTAAHCVSSIELGEPVHVRLGELDVSKEMDCVPDLYCADPPVDVEIEKIIAHKNYQKSSLKNDIALLRLKTTVNQTRYTSPICLPFDLSLTGEEETNYTVAGWGKTKGRSVHGSDALLFTKVESAPVSECNEVVPRIVRPIGELQLCAGGTGEHASCKGDSGGPLMHNKEDADTGDTTTYQIGIVSFGANMCGTDFPNVYTRVTSYLKWILTNLEP